MLYGGLDNCHVMAPINHVLSFPALFDTEFCLPQLAANILLSILWSILRAGGNFLRCARRRDFPSYPHYTELSLLGGLFGPFWSFENPSRMFVRGDAAIR